MLNLSIVLPKIEREANSQQYGRFVIGPLESGYGVTLGNALRRVLLSSLAGAAVTSVRLSDVHHEFSPIPHVREDTTAFILNVKQLRMKSMTDDPVRAYLEVNAEGPVTAGDLQYPPEIEVITPDLLLMTADSNDVDLSIEMVIRRGRGYSPAEERSKLTLGEIPVDAIFSPVRKASFRIERARIGQQTDYDRLVLDIWTDGTITPEEALGEAAKLLVQHLSLIAGVEAISLEPEEEIEEGIPSQIYDVPIESLELSVRAYNCLKRAGIVKVGEIIERLERGPEELLSIRNFGQKSLDELMEKLETKGYLDQIKMPGDEPEEPELEEDEDYDEDLGDDSSINIDVDALLAAMTTGTESS
ncbi:MAG: DNA-directed RNA polymerase subunit alpha [Chloroflexota bacterium]|nr:DNA-directed RNA polymerase subunit alpha [Chloroflexota bacterium]